MRQLITAVVLFVLPTIMLAQSTQPLVAIHESELTQALETTVAGSSTPTGPGTTGQEWWTPWWHYYNMSDYLEEALRSDGTPYVIVRDADISAGNLLNADGSPKYPIVISLASEAINNNEITPLLNYVSAGGFLFVGSSSFTRNPDGTNRGDFAIANAMGMHSATTSLDNWLQDTTLTKQVPHLLVSQLPNVPIFWWMPATNDDTSWGTSLPGETEHFSTGNGPAVNFHYIWGTTASGATAVLTGDNAVPYLTTMSYGKGNFVYDAAMQPIQGNGGWAPSMFAYGIFRNAIQWAFATSNLPIVKVSPWPYQYNAAYEVRHDFEDYQTAITQIEASAKAESQVGALGDYYFCTGTLRVEMNNDPSVIASLQRAVTLYGATIGSHNGGLQNPNNPALQVSDYDYWHWGTDEALDDQPSGYASGSAYALASLSQAFSDVDGWLTGYEANRRTYVSPYFNGTREGSSQILQQLGVLTSGEQKVGPFPHWTVSAQTKGKLYGFVTLPPSEWFIAGNIAQSQETVIPPPWTESTLESAVDYYYSLGGLIDFYSHEPSTNSNIYQYVLYSAAKPSVWPVNAMTVYNWWTKRTPVKVSPSYAIGGNRFITTATISGATDPNTAIELVVPNWPVASTGIQVQLNGSFASPSSYRIYNQGIKVLVGTNVTSVQVSYPLTAGPTAQNDSYSVVTGNTLTVHSPGVLSNDNSAGGGSLTAALATATSNGTLAFNADGSFSYVPASGFVGTDRFTYYAINSAGQSGVATAVLNVTANGNPVVFTDDFSGQIGSDSFWTTISGTWAVANSMMNGTSTEGQYGFAYGGQSWTNYTVQAQFKFSPGAWGGGLGGRVNTATGAHYGAWLYPEGSLGPSAVVKVVKFPNWGTWSGNPMATATIPNLGKTWHTLTASFNGSAIQVSVDGTPYINVTDNGFDSQAPYASGAISLDMWTNPGFPSVMSVKNVSEQALSAAPAAQDDSYSVSAGNTLTVNAPGVLSNDTSLGGLAMSATMVSPPANGAITLQSSGGFTYVPTPGFSGIDQFTYQASSTGGNSNIATVTVTVLPPGSQVFFSDNFGGQGTDPLWTTVSGTWTVANGVMTGISPSGSYGNAYVSGSWTDYSVETQIQFSPGAWGGGIGGQLNSTTGAHYGVWVLPGGTSGQSPSIEVVKFEGWTTWGGTLMAAAPVPTLSSGWHSLLVTFHGNGSVQASLDGVQYINVTDTGFDSQPVYSSGGISLDMWTGTPSLMNIKSLLVFSASPIAQNDSYQVSQGSTLAVSAPGVLSNDTGNGSSSFTAAVITPPANGTLNLQPNGSFTYVPQTSFSGIDSFTYQANAGGASSNVATVTITVVPTGSQVLFSDNFSGSGTDPLWTSVQGTWTVANGTMHGSGPLQNYATAYTSGNWTDYTVQAGIQLPAGAFGSGIGGRVNPSTGAHYAAWIYPEGPLRVSAVLELIKFEGWTTWSGTPMATVSLPNVGTTPHTLILGFQGNNVQVSYNGTPYINVTDNGFDSQPAFTVGGISLDLWTYETPYVANITNVLVLSQP
jgi:hypothetical protein